MSFRTKGNWLAVAAIACWMLMIVNGAMAQGSRVEVSSSLNPVGSGARALGMGGAFIATADDATAASWNPGGLIQLEKPEVSIVGGYHYRSEDLSFGTDPEANGSHSVDITNINYLSAAYPFQLFERNMIVSFNYQNQYNFGRDWRFTIDGIDDDGDPYQTESVYKQDGDLYATGLAFCAKLFRGFSLGVTVNYWGDFLTDNEWNQDYQQSWTYFGQTVSTSTWERYEMDGWNANVGFLWRINEQWTIGGVFKSPFTASIKHRITGTNPSIDYTFKENMGMPLSYGAGVSWRMSDTFTMSADVYRTQWDEYYYKKENGEKYSPVSGKEWSQSDVKPTTWARLGAEYLFIKKKMVIPVRAGVFYDPAPAEGSPDDFYGFSVGSGIGFERFAFDMAYQFRYGDDVGNYILDQFKFSEDVQEHTVYASVIVYF